MQVLSNSICALVFRRTGPRIQYLMMRRIPDRGGFWQSVSGRVNKGEAAEDGARREVLEETSLEPRTVVLLETVNVFFKPGEEVIYLEPCFGVEVVGGDPTLSGEHDAYRWLEIADAQQVIAFSGVRHALDELDRRLAAAKAAPLDG
jgi:lipoyl(octanoyl) transferase